jgi:hypothetical protein
MSISANVITGIYLQWQDYTLVGAGTAKRLPRQTLKVVEAEARDFTKSLGDWNARTTSAHISIYEVLNLRLFVRTMADVW